MEMPPHAYAVCDYAFQSMVQGKEINPYPSPSTPPTTGSPVDSDETC